MSESVSKERLLEFKNGLIAWIGKSEETVNEIRAIADDLHEHFQKISKWKIGGSSFGIVGGTLCTVGFGLSFVTFGASFALSIIGGVIAGAGGVVVGGAMIKDVARSKDKKDKTEEILKTYNKTIEEWKKECVAIGYSLEEILKKSNSPLSMAEAFPKWYRFWFNLIIGAGNITKGAGWNCIATTIITSLRIVTSFDDPLVAGVKVGSSLFKTLGPAAKGFHIAGGVIGIVLIPLDIYTLVDAAIDVHKDNPNETVHVIRQIAANLEKECPKKNDIEAMIKETSNLLERFS